MTTNWEDRPPPQPMAIQPRFPTPDRNSRTPLSGIKNAVRCGVLIIGFKAGSLIPETPGLTFVFVGDVVTRVFHRIHAAFMLNCASMQQFVIERDVPGAGRLTEAQIRDVSLKSLGVLKDMGPQIQWLHSYVTEDKVYCVYLAPDENMIREHARRVGIPADRVSAVRRLIAPANFQ